VRANSSLVNRRTNYHHSLSIASKLEKLKNYWGNLKGSCAIGFSGGVDSAFLLISALKWAGVKIYPVLANSCFVSVEALDQARLVGRQIGVDVLEIYWEPLNIPEIQKNDRLRCYYCKKNLYLAIKSAISKRDRLCDNVFDGTQFDDLFSHRPGLYALLELEIQTPLAIFGFTKSDIRSILRKWGFDFWNIPAASCLATQIQPGTSLTKERLNSINFELKSKKAPF